MKLIHLAFAVLLSSAGGLTQAQQLAEPSFSAQALVDRATRDTMQVKLDTDGPLGYRLICLQGKNEAARPVIGWTTPEYKQLFVGMLFNGDGQDLSKLYFPVCRELTEATRQASTTVPTTVPTSPQGTSVQAQDNPLQMIEDRAQGFSVAGDVEGKPLFVFSDPNCPHCKNFWSRVANLDEKSLSQINIVKIPVAVSDRSLADSVVEMTKVIGLSQDDAELVVVKNTALFLELARRDDLVSTPYLVWRDAKGTVQQYFGNPDEKLKGILDAIRGEP